MDKSAFYVAGVPESFKEQLIQEMHFTTGAIPVTYVGVPLSSRKLTIQQCLPLVEKITARVSCWTSKLLSYSGRLQLIKSVLFEMNTYWGQVFLLPKKVIKMVNTICRVFLWTGSNVFSKKALVAWDTICQPQAAGGLNVIAFEQWNKAAICKLLWALTHRKETLWVQWIHGYYIKCQDLASMSTPKQACWIVRKIFEAKSWFPNTNAITHLNQFEVGGRFNIKKTYTAWFPQLPRPNWKNLLLSSGPLPRHHFILWLAVQNRLATVDRLAKWNIQVPMECVMCSSQAVETMQHLFFDCTYSKYIWHTILTWLGIQKQIGTWEEEVQWLSQRVKNKRPR
ncbi:uncharacterized protein LOC132630951 [Lycium barbarum]|uniref:uncharacterized protein LOC132630951 n=1 Tax=Lycium barbarum TaxID=112863 RepID=UPI00293F1433|nr:uncharacterized protein LOC132630951 [Lycium barbarum]